LINIIQSNFEISENNLNEFFRILLPDIEYNLLKVEILEETKENIKILIDLDNKIEIILYENILDKLDDLKVIMIKIGLLKLFGKTYSWGSLTGMRPIKLIRKMRNKMEYNEIYRHLIDLFMLEQDKANLLLAVAKNSEIEISNNQINIYIGIPFCPTKCTYCSFASYTISGKYIDIYRKFIDLLIEEIIVMGDFIKKNNLIVDSIYIGGGTPTILNEIDLDKILLTINNNIDRKNLREYTVEAGRIDTLTEKKLDIIKKYNIDRISLNPQTFNLNTLKLVNREWDQDKFNKLYNYSKKLGLTINMDFIIGLPNETTEDIISTFNKLLDYNIENLTIHVLAIKKASNLFKNQYKSENFIDYKKIQNKIDIYLNKYNLEPYYLYRQKNSLEIGENVGYAKKGYESRFNIFMIEESQNTIGIGGGAITKFFKNGELIRIVNPKDPSVYVLEFEKRLEEKIDKLNKI